MEKKYYEKYWIINILKISTVVLILLTQIEFILKGMLLFGYFMLFRQERWHKHLLIMFIMITIMAITTRLL